MFTCPDCGLVWSNVHLVRGTKRASVVNPPERYCGCNLNPMPVIDREEWGYEDAAN